MYRLYLDKREYFWENQPFKITMLNHSENRELPLKQWKWFIAHHYETVVY